MCLVSMLAAAGDALPVSYGWALLRMLVALVVVCGAVYLVLRFGLKRLTGARATAQRMRVVDRCSLSANRGLWIVEVGGRTLLLGEAEGGISNLAELDPEQLAAPALHRQRPRFAEIFARARGDRATPPEPGPVDRS